MKRKITLLMVLPLLLLSNGCSDNPATPREPSTPVLLVENAYQPSWSPDGETIYFSRWIEAYEHSQIMALEYGQTEAVELFRGVTLANPMPTPDGTHIVCLRFDDGSGEIWFEKYTMGGVLVVSWPVEDFWGGGRLSLSPDGGEVVYTTHEEPPPLPPVPDPSPTAVGVNKDEAPYLISAFDLETGATRVLREGRGGVLSPQGDQLAFGTREDPGITDEPEYLVCIADADDLQSTVIGAGAWPTWMPDGNSLIYTGMRSAELSDLILTSLPDGPVVWLTDDPEIEWNSAVSPDGMTILYTRSAGEWEPMSIWVIEL